MFSSLVEGIRISVFEFSFAKGSVTWNGSRKPRPCEPEQKFSVINTTFQPFEIISLPLLGCKVVEKIDNLFFLERYQYSEFNIFNISTIMKLC